MVTLPISDHSTLKEVSGVNLIGGPAKTSFLNGSHRMTLDVTGTESLTNFKFRL